MHRESVEGKGLEFVASQNERKRGGPRQQPLFTIGDHAGAGGKGELYHLSPEKTEEAITFSDLHSTMADGVGHRLIYFTRAKKSPCTIIEGNWVEGGGKGEGVGREFAKCTEGI